MLKVFDKFIFNESEGADFSMIKVYLHIDKFESVDSNLKYSFKTTAQKSRNKAILVPNLKFFVLVKSFHFFKSEVIGFNDDSIFFQVLFKKTQISDFCFQI